MCKTQKKDKIQGRTSPGGLSLQEGFEKWKPKGGQELENILRCKTEPKDRLNYVQHPCRLLTNHWPLD